MKIKNFKLKIRQSIIIFPAIIVILTQFVLLNDGLFVYGQTLPNYSITGPLVSISASIGSPILKLWGYGAPNSRVELSGDKVSDFTYTKVDGYFEFSKTYLPQATDIFYPELCLTEIDQTGRATTPTCIPRLLATKDSYNIGPVILPPTLSLTEGVIDTTAQSGASGITIPNSEVRVVLAEDNKNLRLTNFNLVKPVLAYYIPNYTIKSDSQGHFSFNMPGVNPNGWRVFVFTHYSEEARSPKSNTLKFVIISPTVSAIGNIWTFILSLFTLPSLIILEIVVILLIFVGAFLNRRDRKKVSPNTIK